MSFGDVAGKTTIISSVYNESERVGRGFHSNATHRSEGIGQTDHFTLSGYI